MCIDIVEIWFGIANGRFFDIYLPPHSNGWVLSFHIFITRNMIVVGYYGFTLYIRVSVHPSVSHTSVYFSFPDDNLSKHQWIFTKLGMCIDIVEIWFGIANGQILSIFYGDLPETCPYFRFGMIT